MYSLSMSIHCTLFYSEIALTKPIGDYGKIAISCFDDDNKHLPKHFWSKIIWNMSFFLETEVNLSTTEFAENCIFRFSIETYYVVIIVCLLYKAINIQYMECAPQRDSNYTFFDYFAFVFSYVTESLIILVLDLFFVIVCGVNARRWQIDNRNVNELTQKKVNWINWRQYHSTS